MKKCFIIVWSMSGEVYNGRGFYRDESEFKLYSDELEATKEVERLTAIYNGRPISIMPCYVTPK